MKNTTIGIITAILVFFGFIVGRITADPVEIKTVEKEKIVHPDFKFETGTKTHCDLGTQIKPCEIIGKKSSGLYVIKYRHDGIAGGEKIIDIPASDIIK